MRIFSVFKKCFLPLGLFCFAVSSLAVDVVDFSKESPQLQVKKIRIQNGEMQLQIEQLQQKIMRLQGSIEQYQYRLKTLEGVVEKITGAGDVQPDDASASTTISSASSSSTVTNATVDEVDEEGDLDMYEDAFSQLKAKKYQLAMTKFKGYLKRYKNGAYVPNAHYWLGELYLIDNQKTLAESTFNKIIDQYPSSSKVVDSKYKLAQLYHRDDKHGNSKALLQELMSANNSDARVNRLATDFWNKHYAN